MRTKILLPLIAAIGCITLTSSCANVLTKDDATELGAVIAQDALAVAAQAATGQWIDLKLSATQTGLKIANLALIKATANITRDVGGNSATVLAGDTTSLVKAESARIVREALTHAQEQIAAGDDSDPKLAQLFSAGSAQTALNVLGANRSDGTETAYAMTATK